MERATDPDLRALVGRVIDGRYVLREWIGGGGFGAVFRSEQYVLGRAVRPIACKVSRRPDLTEESAGELFADVLVLADVMGSMTDLEARRHLVHVYDAGLASDLGGRAYLVMEYVQGGTLAAEFTRMDRVPPRLMVKWARQIAVALRGLHCLVPPLLHRDLKPDNVLLGQDRAVRLIDFGLAARMRAAGQVEGIAGTAGYMAPETAAGASLPASDLYSLGLLMYEGLTGRRPYEHLVVPLDLPERALGEWLVEAKHQAPPVRPSAVEPTVAPELDDIVMRCMELRPADRFRGADEFIAAVDALPEPGRGGRVGGTGAPAPLQGRPELTEARRLLREGEPGAAIDLLRLVLGRGGAPRELLPALLAELARAHEELGEHAAAARQWAQAHEYVCSGLRPPEGLGRERLAHRAEKAFWAAGNKFQAGHFARLARDGG
ncbi:serine/threonine-protein kinase [Streptomyces sp. VRA16 Mangrove soil]|uniref:serine/threonine-protein kinase n=1 Tax=Streptomyces sp. VRA16 Mangrove soil TaxID=2817434 RepID=UPI001A9DEA9E|nr:serine/threonine-protein kinase [Streptomyces sp. VRA16 Mangrove soil]MBO1334962.1 serine/threonine protein kinase [Streptomyces sp. VRA16 Mangrove soil]